MAEYAATELSLNRIGVFHVNDDFGLSFEKNI
jgi:hypothetical protein